MSQANDERRGSGSGRNRRRRGRGRGNSRPAGDQQPEHTSQEPSGAPGKDGKDGKDGARGRGQRGRKRGNRRKHERGRSPQREQAKGRQDPAGFWGEQDALPVLRQDVRLTDDPAAVPRSLGPAPLPGHEAVAEHYFRVVYERAVATAGALAAAGGLIDLSAVVDDD